MAGFCWAEKMVQSVPLITAWLSPLHPLDQRVLRVLAALGVRVVDEEHHDPFLAAS